MGAGVSKAKLKQCDVTRVLLGAMDALERRGHAVKAVHISVDGGMTVLTEAPAEAVASPTRTLTDWVALAGEKAVSRA